MGKKRVLRQKVEARKRIKKFKNGAIGTPDDIMSKIPVLDSDTIEILKNCDLT